MNSMTSSAARVLCATLACTLFGGGCATLNRAPLAANAPDLGARVALAETRRLHQLRLERSTVEEPPAARRLGSDTLTLSEMGPVFVAAGDSDSQETGGYESVAEGQRSSEERGPLPGFRETVKRDIKRMPRSLWDDTKAVYTDPGNLVILGAAGAASLSVRVTGVDGRMDNSHGRHDTFQDEWSDAIGVVGNPITHFGLAGLWYLVGQQTQDEKTYEVGRTMFNALMINGASTMVLKMVANTDSPNGEGWAWPSGHTSSSFTMAEVLRVSYGPWVGVPCYALATLGAFGRIDDREHDLSDLIFGAALGIVVGHTVAEGHSPEIFGGEITPYVSANTGAGGIAWIKSF